MLNRRSTFAFACASLVSALAADADAALLSTDFDNSGVSGNTMNGVVWTENGLSAPTSITASAAVRNNTAGSANGDAGEGYFSPNANINGSTEGAPAWTATFTVTVGASDVSLTDIVLLSAESNSGSALGAGNGSSNINISIVDNNTTGTVFDVTEVRNDNSGVSQVLTYTPTSPVTLTAGNTYDVTFKLWESNSSGNFESLDSLTFNGSVVPEPGSLALLGLGGLLIARRRRD